MKKKNIGRNNHLFHSLLAKLKLFWDALHQGIQH